MNKILIVLLILLLFAISCHKSSTEPELNLEEEAELIPWDIITGKLIYSRIEQSDETWSFLFLVDGAEKKIHLLRKTNTVQFNNLAMKYDGQIITFTDFDSYRGKLQLFNINGDGSNIKQIYVTDAHSGYAAWSQDGHLAFWYNGQSPHVMEIRVDGKVFFDRKYCAQTRPAWSPVDNYMVLSLHDSSTTGSLFRVALWDTTYTLLLRTQGRANDEIFLNPIYSPDGSQIAFNKEGNFLGNNSEIWVVNADGSQPTRLTSGHYDNYPAWSPDGQYIAFSRGRGNDAHLYLVNVQTHEVKQITKKPGQYPCWIP